MASISALRLRRVCVDDVHAVPEEFEACPYEVVEENSLLRRKEWVQP